MEDKDYKFILEKISAPILVAIPEYKKDEDFAEDFKITFINDSFKRLFPDFIKDKTASELCLRHMPPEVPWTEIANEAIKSGEGQSLTYYSPNYATWFKISMNATANKLLLLTFTNVNNEKETEQRLLRQNLRLASLTDELSDSREDLKKRLEYINSLNAQLEFNAYHDMLTGLYGRRKFQEDIEQFNVETDKKTGKFAIFIADIDDLKLANDSLGHRRGDELICTTGDVLKSFESEDVKAYRFGGDEFLILVKNLSSHEEFLDFGRKILSNLNEKGIKLSLGFSMYPDDTKIREELLRYADMAMYEVKRHGKNDIDFFKSIMRERFMKRVQIQTRLSSAMSNDSFHLYYQPQFDARTNKLRGFEALLRWQDSELGWINPEQFIPIAEETKLVIPLGDWILETAIQTLKQWQDEYNFDGIMSINVSPIQLKKTTFIQDLKALVEKYEIAHESLEIEITEGVLIDNKEDVINLLRQIREMNIGISLDDFGTGYSSLSYLQMLPITTLKIDKSFIANITDKSGVEANITDSIISMVTKMGLDTIAEGVEKPEQLNVLKDINCRNIQGFLKGKPMPKARCETILNGNYELADHL